MSDDFPKICRPDTSQFSENRTKIPPEVMLQYAGEWIAWSPDGSRVLAHGKELDPTIEALKAGGHNPHAVVWESVPLPGEEDTLL